MKKKVSSTLALLLSLAMIFAFVAVPAYADNEKKVTLSFGSTSAAEDLITQAMKMVAQT